METKRFRQSLTLSDHLSTIHSSNLADLLKFRHDDDPPRPGPRRRVAGDSTTLASLIATARTGRSLLDIIRHDHDLQNHTSDATSQETPQRSNLGESPPATTTPEVPRPAARVSLMALLERSGEDEGATSAAAGAWAGFEAGAGAGSSCVCCVCMAREKGAAFIPCGHTFCRVCSRELWVSRGSCPLCNACIVEILDIF